MSKNKFPKTVYLTEIGPCIEVVLPSDGPGSDDVQYIRKDYVLNGITKALESSSDSCDAMVRIGKFFDSIKKL